MLYEILPDALRSNYDPTQNPRPHVDGIIGSANVNSTDLVMNQMKDLSLRQSVVGQALSLSSTPTQLENVHSLVAGHTIENVNDIVNLFFHSTDRDPSILLLVESLTRIHLASL